MAGSTGDTGSTGAARFPYDYPYRLPEVPSPSEVVMRRWMRASPPAIGSCGDSCATDSAGARGHSVVQCGTTGSTGSGETA